MRDATVNGDEKEGLGHGEPVEGSLARRPLPAESQGRANSEKSSLESQAALSFPALRTLACAPRPLPPPRPRLLLHHTMAGLRMSVVVSATAFLLGA